jgi:hypothetical protein
VVVHRRGGITEELTSSVTIDLDGKTVSLERQSSDPQQIEFHELKALFFLRSTPLLPDEPPADVMGPLVSIEFSDGETIRGIAPDYSPDAPGFFLHPLDRSKNELVFVIGEAIVSIDIEKL